MEDIPVTILKRFDEIYLTLSQAEELIAIPERELLRQMLDRCSFKMFEDSDEYIGNERAQNFPNFISPSFGSHAFRVYFNSYSNKIYVDLNREPMQAIRITPDTEQTALCEMIRSIIMVDLTAC